MDEYTTFRIMHLTGKPRRHYVPAGPDADRSALCGVGPKGTHRSWHDATPSQGTTCPNCVRRMAPLMARALNKARAERN